MSRMSSILVAATAVVLTAGAAQFASGHDLLSPLSGASVPVASAGLTHIEDAQRDHVNRATKGDRMEVNAGDRVAMQTFAVRVSGLSNTSVLIRAPIATPGKEAHDIAPVRTPAILKAPAVAPKATVACEPMVSVLTEVAKQLAPGRCIT